MKGGEKQVEQKNKKKKDEKRISVCVAERGEIRDECSVIHQRGEYLCSALGVCGRTGVRGKKTARVERARTLRMSGRAFSITCVRLKRWKSASLTKPSLSL